MTKWIYPALAVIFLGAITPSYATGAEKPVISITESRFIIYLDQGVFQKKNISMEAFKKEKLLEWQKKLNVSISTLPAPDNNQWVIKITGTDDAKTNKLRLLIEKDPVFEEIERDRVIMPM